MSYSDYPDPVERRELTEVEELVVDLMAEYMERRSEGAMELYDTLVARAAAHGGDHAAEAFEIAVASWETARLIGDA